MEFKRSFNIVYIKCHEAAINLNYNIYKEDISEGIILFKIDVSLLSWGEKFRIEITRAGANNTRVEIASEAAYKAQLIDWGKNNENVQFFFNTLNELLKR